MAGRKKTGYMRLRITLLAVITVILAVSLFFSAYIENVLGLSEGVNIETKDFEREGSDEISTVLGGEAVIHFIDVGQGDATLIELPSETEVTDDSGEIPGTFILIDGGSKDNKTHAAKNPNGHLKIMDYLDERFKDIDNFIFDYVILTHQHEDHCGGLSDVLNKYPAQVVYRPNSRSTHKNGDPLINNLSKTYAQERIWGDPAAKYDTATKTYNDFLQAAYKTRFLDGEARITKEVRVTNAGDAAQNSIKGDIAYEDSNRTVIDGDDSRYFELMFHTPRSAVYSDVNDYSPIITLDFNGKRAFITGDATLTAEQEFLDRYKGITFGEADIIRIAHHGSKTSSGQAFLDKITTEQSRPQTLIVISVGVNNEYKHPNSEILGRLDESGFAEDNILRTDLNGDIAISITYDVDSDEYVLKFGASVIRSITTSDPPVPIKWWHIAVSIWVISLIVIFSIHKSKNGGLQYEGQSRPGRNTGNKAVPSKINTTGNKTSNTTAGKGNTLVKGARTSAKKSAGGKNSAPKSGGAKSSQSTAPKPQANNKSTAQNGKNAIEKIIKEISGKKNKK